MARALDVGSDGYLIEGSRRNAVNGVQTAIRRRGIDIEVSAVRLRHYWAVDLMQYSIPTAVFMQIADLGDSHTLYELSKFVRAVPDSGVAGWFAGAVR